MKIKIDDNRECFYPYETLSGYFEWDFVQPPRKMILTLYWKVHGMGGEKSGSVEKIVYRPREKFGRIKFRVSLPDGPYSLKGRLFSIDWALELFCIADRDWTTEVPLIISPTQEIIDAKELMPERKT